MMRKNLLLLLALVFCTIASTTVLAQGNYPEWYRVQRVVTGSDPCAPDQFMGMLIVTFPWNPGPDGDPRVTGDNPFDCYGLDGGRLDIDGMSRQEGDHAFGDAGR